MNYQVLARKWRPRTFVEVVGQQLVLQALHNALAAGVVHHAYLFTGDRGVGKTTITRIIAKCLNCAQGITTEPCGSCDSCLAIDAGKHMDVIEVDAASRTKVEDTRSLLENVAYAPTSGRFKVYIIDEVHMLSNHSFNALLKTLEEPPSHVKFLLATTDPKKLPVTILSRCLQFHLRNFTQRQITQHLGKVLAAEGVAYTEAALNRLSQAAGGSMRDALMLLEQAIALSMPSKAQGSESIRQEQAIQTSQDDANILNEGQASRAECETKYSSEITLDLVLQMLGTVGEQVVLALLLAIVKSDSARAFEIIVELELQAADFKSVIQELQGLLHKIAVLQVLPEYQEQQIDSVENTRDELSVLANSILPQDVQVLYQVALHGLRDLPYAPSMRLGFEMLVLRMLCFQPIKVCAVGLESAEKHDTSKTDIETKNLTQEHKDAESCQAKVIPKALQVAIRSQDQVNSEPSRQQRRSLKGEGYIAKIDADACIGCSLCIPACPVDAIIGARKFMHTVLTAECIGCKLCVPACPVDCIAIETKTITEHERRALADKAKLRYQARVLRLAKQKQVYLPVFANAEEQSTVLKADIAASLARVKAKNADGEHKN